MKIEIELLPGMWAWLKSQRNWQGVVIEALAEYRHNPKRKWEKIRQDKKENEQNEKNN